MGSDFMDSFFYILLAVGAVTSLYSGYFIIMALAGLRKRRTREISATTPHTRFAVLIAARNEEAVIGQLVDSLNQQDYPRHLYDIIVAPNNCTDHTGQVAKAHGAQLFHPVGTIRSKGEVLTQAMDWISKSGRYDSICVFDADNLVHPDFLKKMNDARAEGVRVAQGFRDSKNPTDTPISTCYSVCYWILSRLYNASREAFGLSSLINGSGFMVDVQLLDTLGGWHTSTMTEDYEFSAQCLLAGEKVRYVPDAIIYDEQPLTFIQSWKQRRRWTTGSVQGMEKHLGGLLGHGLRHRSWAHVDLAITFSYPAVQLVSIATSALTFLMLAYRIFYLGLMPAGAALLMGLGMLAGIFALCTLIPYLMIRHFRRGRSTANAGRGAAFFPFFLLTWIPITLISLFKKQTTWDAIAHTRTFTLKDVHHPSLAG